jgi:hypothetical protein
VGRDDPAARRDGRVALPIPDRTDATVSNDRLDTGGPGERRPVEPGREKDELVVETRPVDAVNAPPGALGRDDLGPEIDVDDGQPRLSACVRNGQTGPLAGRLAEDLAGQGQDPRRLSPVYSFRPEISAVRCGQRAAAGGDRAGRLGPDAPVEGPAEVELDFRRVEDEDIDRPAVGADPPPEFPAPDLDVLDPGRDGLGPPRLRQVLGPFASRRRGGASP